MTGAEHNQEFRTTRWSLIASSQDVDSELRRKSLGELCGAYWYPLFIYLRRKGHTPEASADFVQEFFRKLIEKPFLQKVTPDKGRFRWFLMSAIQKHVANEVAKEKTVKRGGNIKLFSIDVEQAESRYRLEPVDGWTPEKLFERRWAMEVLQQAIKKLEEDQTKRGKLELYQTLRSTLTGNSLRGREYESIGRKFSMSPGAVKVAALRLREKYRDCLKSIVSRTIDDESEIEDEINNLLSALRQS